MAVTTIHNSFDSQIAQTANMKKDSVTNHKGTLEKSFEDLIQAIHQFKLGYQTMLPDRNPPLSSTESIDKQPTSDPFRNSSTDSVHQTRSARFKKLLADPIVELKQLKETDGIEDYHEKFGVLSTRVNVSEASLVSIFLDGLWTDTKTNIQMFNPQTIRQCLAVGRLYERVHQKKSTIQQLVHTEQIKEASSISAVIEDSSGIMEEASTISAAEEIMEVGYNIVDLSEELEVNKEVVCDDDQQGEVSSFSYVTAQQEFHIVVQQKHKALPQNSLFEAKAGLEMENSREEQFGLLWPSLFLSVTCELVVNEGFKKLSRQHETRRPNGTAYASEFMRFEAHKRVWEPGGVLGEHAYWKWTDDDMSDIRASEEEDNGMDEKYSSSLFPATQIWDPGRIFSIAEAARDYFHEWLQQSFLINLVVKVFRKGKICYRKYET